MGEKGEINFQIIHGKNRDPDCRNLGLIKSMSLHPQPIPPVPEQTVRVALAAFPKGNIYLQIRDTLGSIYVDEDFADLFSVKGQPAQSPWRLALICIMQYMENLSDRQACRLQSGEESIGNMRFLYLWKTLDLIFLL